MGRGVRESTERQSAQAHAVEADAATSAYNAADLELRAAREENSRLRSALATLNAQAYQLAATLRVSDTRLNAARTEFPLAKQRMKARSTLYAPLAGKTPLAALLQDLPHDLRDASITDLSLHGRDGKRLWPDTRWYDAITGGRTFGYSLGELAELFYDGKFGNLRIEGQSARPLANVMVEVDDAGRPRRPTLHAGDKLALSTLGEVLGADATVLTVDRLLGITRLRFDVSVYPRHEPEPASTRAYDPATTSVRDLLHYVALPVVVFAQFEDSHVEYRVGRDTAFTVVTAPASS